MHRIATRSAPAVIPSHSTNRCDQIATGYRTSTTGPPIAITTCQDSRLRPSQIPGTQTISVAAGYPLQSDDGRHSRRLLSLLDRLAGPHRAAAAVAGARRHRRPVLPRPRTDRPGLDQALAALREGDTLVVPKLDRVCKSLSLKANTRKRAQCAVRRACQRHLSARYAGEVQRCDRGPCPARCAGRNPRVHRVRHAHRSQGQPGASHRHDRRTCRSCRRHGTATLSLPRMQGF